MLKLKTKEKTMTLDELIKMIDVHLPGNRFDNDMKTMWLNEIEGKVFDEIEKPTFKPFGNELRLVKRNNKGEFEYVKQRVNELPKEYKEEDDSAGTEEDNDSSANDTHYAREIDPLDLRRTGCCNRQQPCYELAPYRYDLDKETRLIIPDRFQDVYVHYILAKMHQADSEIDNYNNEVLLFDASYKDYAAWHIRNFRRH